MEKVIALLAAIFVFSLCNPAKATLDAPPVVWQKTLGGSDSDYGRSVQQTTDGGFIIAGSTHSFGEGYYGDVYLIKTDSAGNKIWQKTFGGSKDDSGDSVRQTTDGGFIIAGSTCTFREGSGDVYLIKTDPNGNSQWQKTLGGSKDDGGYSVQQTTDGGFIIAGGTQSFGAGRDVYLIKTDSAGNLVWQKTFGGENSDGGYSVQQTTDGGFIIAGYTYSFGAGGLDIYLIKTNPNGNSQWQKTFGGSSNDCGYSVQQTADGGFIIAGGTQSFGAGSEDVYLIKTDSDGNEVWQKTFSGSDGDVGNSVQQTTDGGFIIAGSTHSFGAGYYGDVYLIRTDSAGNLLWQKTFDGSSVDYGFSVQQTADGGFIIAGCTSSFGAGNDDVYLVKVGFEGCERWDFNCDRSVDFFDFAEFAEHWLEEK